MTLMTPRVVIACRWPHHSVRAKLATIEFNSRSIQPPNQRLASIVNDPLYRRRRSQAASGAGAVRCNRLRLLSYRNETNYRLPATDGWTTRRRHQLAVETHQRWRLIRTTRCFIGGPKRLTTVRKRTPGVRPSVYECLFEWIRRKELG